MSIKITIYTASLSSGDGFRAQTPDKHFEVGRSITEAIGELSLNDPARFGVELEITPEAERQRIRNTNRRI